VLAKHSKSFSLIDCISVGVDRMQRNFEPMRKQASAAFTLDVYSHILPHMQDDAAAKVEAALLGS